MPTFPPHAVIVALLLAAGSVAAQPVPPTPPPQHHGAGPVKPTVKAAPRTKVESTPLVRQKPGAPAHHPSKPAVTHPAPVPAPAPGAGSGGSGGASPAPSETDKSAEPSKGSNTGNPLPRFATLRSDEVNLRTGPGTRYPIDWVYKRRDLPVMIEREFEVWRLVRDPEGVKGWVHQATLAPRRTGVVIGGERVLRSDPQDSAGAVARLQPGVIVRLRSCEAAADWCQASVQDYRGWIRRTEIWGTFPGEAIQ